ncbi:flagellar basal-body MS-ring/collar protein FliF [Microbulbifer thermotolerans]|uniref:Flagellar M-ring protein n=1 Tax=Microbulbifer thermotolerans TaxID=252514 RepID=A0A143HN85_MICTH|nr:flagellar basal-body MS-ring/collar protein FliF [Microbulbifer thermotolerans]AMX03169.1 flagellar M-ring protein FliF [Microbulbifer thermotolerans]MCX2783470.1 flagellar basal-body MS-ring/collar protein FliF [Microbulbifer thermotolerans]MCX2795864.1 flagellar basal-body MS-ring/collar protein FliF [Microbulbifer thermotolerans]MCX2835522.1 flagellar basal-body MS-ring/collar protein FliF [Microbulbifer thermotolerans]WKT59734.1 flagellar basal-body MS-ring/collar protein FliF [Microbul
MSGAIQTNPGSATPALSQLSARLFTNPLIPLLVAGSAAVALLVALWMWAGAPEYRVLYSNLSEEDGGRIISELESRAVPYEFTQGGRTLLVPGDQVYKLRLQLAEQGLPQGANAGFEIMDNQAFGVSQFAEQVNFQRGLQGELASSIESLGPVSRARVHLSMAKPSVFIREREPAKASVVLTLAPGRSLGDGQVNAIVHLVSSSVPDLTMENVTVVDQNGRLLSRPGGNLGLDGSRLEYVRDIEQHYRQRIENILAPIFGNGNIRAQVAAEIDFDQREETSERYTPNQDGLPAAVRSEHRNTDFDGDPEAIGGIPGALTNTPPGAAASPIDLNGDNNNDEAEQTDSEENNRGRLRREQLVNYELDRNITHIQRQRGRILRLSAAVVVNYREAVTEEGATEQVPLSDAELERVENLVRQAMGYSEDRGDSLQIVNSPFAPVGEALPEDIPWYKDPFWQRALLSLARYLLAALAVLMVYRLVLRPLVDRYARLNAEAIAPPAPTAVPQSATVQNTNNAERPEEAEAEEEIPPPRRKRRSSAYEQNLKELQEMAKEDPAMVAMIVRSWMNRND